MDQQYQLATQHELESQPTLINNQKFTARILEDIVFIEVPYDTTEKEMQTLMDGCRKLKEQTGKNFVLLTSKYRIFTIKVDE